MKLDKLQPWLDVHYLRIWWRDEARGTGREWGAALVSRTPAQATYASGEGTTIEGAVAHLIATVTS